MRRDDFEHLALEHLDAVYRMAMVLARHPDDASDLVQETYLKALRACDRFEERGGGVRPWLFKILHNAFYSRLRSERRAALSGDGIGDHEHDGAGPDDPAPAFDLASFDWQHVDERLLAAVRGLRPEYRSVLLLWGVEGMKYREISEVQDIPIGTVMSRLHRARAILADQLSELAEENRLRQRSP